MGTNGSESGKTFKSERFAGAKRIAKRAVLVAGGAWAFGSGFACSSGVFIIGVEALTSETTSRYAPGARMQTQLNPDPPTIRIAPPREDEFSPAEQLVLFGSAGLFTESVVVLAVWAVNRKK